MSPRVKRELRDRWLALRLSFRGRVHEYPEVLQLRRFVAAFDIDCIIDVGANAGQHATMLRRDVGFSGTILSFEPNPQVFPALEKNASRDPHWHAFNIALSNVDGTAQFNVMAADQFSSLETPADAMDPIFHDRNRVAQTVDVQCRRLDGLYPELKVAHGCSRTLLKMDTQGHDRLVCEGAGAMLDSMVGIQTELAIRPLYQGGTGYRAMIDLLDGHGFVPSAFFANNKGHFPRLVEMDGLFVSRRVLRDDPV
ncbi:FkbM family methyltransferase [Sphingobium sp. SCG-1]|uniref:FkbM family methyltransferase n=1 Tax=Sphingobium sp. SCG-1 TaxID=2072936 RepID=UPI000CD6A86E|nr:FkbM family methyltransferase [Sphingobium sp. SCG-1]AUW58706.1 FkbM family methyltransferase [Sphingobium sp. SCG-1]